MVTRLRHFLPSIVLMGAIGTTLCIAPPARSLDAMKFPDVPADYWARPFIETLNQQGILAGYPDGTYRPKQAVNRDEFAAVIRQAFNREPVKNIESGSVFKDVPEGNWAAPPIKEAYETGFMKSFPNETFNPKNEITKLEALVSLAQGLNLTYTGAAAIAAVPAPAAAPRAVVIPRKRQKMVKNQLAFPLAMTTMMQSFVRPAIAAVTPPAAPQVPNAASLNAAPGATVPARAYLSKYYQDADKIPAEAVDAVAAATQAGIAVNHPDARRLEPAGVLDRGTAAGLIHQALVYKSKVQPLNANNPASKYVVVTP